jgi:hypothetical protein
MREAGAEDLQTMQESVLLRAITAPFAARDHRMAEFTAEHDVGTERSGSADTVVRGAIGYNSVQRVLQIADYAPQTWTRANE